MANDRRVMASDGVAGNVVAHGRQTPEAVDAPQAPPKPAWRWLALGMLAMGVVIGACGLDLPVPLRDLWSPDAVLAGTAHDVIFGVRLPRVGAALLVGASLAVSGAALQAVFRNPLAEPYLLGISAGGALGATVAAAMQMGPMLGLDAGTVLAFGGALGAALAVYRLGSVRISTLVGGESGFDRSLLLLCGVALSALLAAIMALVVTISQRGDLVAQTSFWLLGGLTRATPSHLVVLALTLGAGLAVMLGSARDLNALQVGDEEAAGLGIEIGRVHRRLLVTAALMSAAAVAAAGLIGFVGLLAPHVMRLLFPGGARTYIPAAALGGALLLTACDTIAHAAAAPVEIPVGVVTALLGVPLFLILARRDSARG